MKDDEKINEIPKKFRINKKLCHLVDFVNDGDKKLVVYKSWLSSKKRWSYFCETESSILYQLNYCPDCFAVWE